MDVSVFLMPDALAGQRIDVVAFRVMGHSRSRVTEPIMVGGMLLDGETVKRAFRVVTTGAMSKLVIKPRLTRVVSRPRLIGDLEIIHEDWDIVVMDEPVGVVARPSLGWEGPPAIEYLATADIAIATSGTPERQGMVSRPGVEISGLMVLARPERAYPVLKQAFRDEAADKAYQAPIQGHPDPFSGTIGAPIGQHPGRGQKMIVVGGGRKPVAHYETFEAHRTATLAKVSLETEYTHQTRVHFTMVGHPCCGDSLHDSNLALARQLGFDRQWLHAARLTFEHPVEGNRVEFKSELPRDLGHALHGIRSD